MSNGKTFNVSGWLMGLVSAAILALVGFAWDSRNIGLDSRVDAQERRVNEQAEKVAKVDELAITLARMEAKFDAMLERLKRVEQKVEPRNGRGR